MFDWLCLSYFIDNSNVKWNHLDLGVLNEQSRNVFASGLTNGSVKCKVLECSLDMKELDALTNKFSCIQECYITFITRYSPRLVLLQLFKISQLKVLHFIAVNLKGGLIIDADPELENCLTRNTTLQELRIRTDCREFLGTFTAIIKGVTKNRTITSFNLDLYYPILLDGILEQLLMNNNTLEALSLKGSFSDSQGDPALLSKINEVHMPLRALEIRDIMIMKSLLPQVKGLHCLILHNPYPLHLIFSSHPNLQTLEVSLETEESVGELLTILQTNTTLKALKVNIVNARLISNFYIDIQNMLGLNQTLSYFEIYHNWKNIYFSPSYIKYNTSLHSVHISMSTSEELKSAFDAISRMKYLTEINFEICNTNSHANNDATLLLYTHFFLAVTKMLQSNTVIRQLWIKCSSDYFFQSDNWREIMQHFYETVFIHPSIEYIEINIKHCKTLDDFLREYKRVLLSKHEQEPTHRKIPIVTHMHV